MPEMTIWQHIGVGWGQFWVGMLSQNRWQVVGFLLGFAVLSLPGVVLITIREVVWPWPR